MLKSIEEALQNGFVGLKLVLLNADELLLVVNFGKIYMAFVVAYCDDLAQFEDDAPLVVVRIALAKISLVVCKKITGVLLSCQQILVRTKLELEANCRTSSRSVLIQFVLDIISLILEIPDEVRPTD